VREIRTGPQSPHDPADFVNAGGMLRGIARRAERAAHVSGDPRRGYRRCGTSMKGARMRGTLRVTWPKERCAPAEGRQTPSSPPNVVPGRMRLVPGGGGAPNPQAGRFGERARLGGVWNPACRGNAGGVGELLEIYLADHMAGAAAGLELSRRAARNARGTETGAFLERLSTEIESDRRTLAAAIARLGLRRSRLKEGLARLAERAGRLKLNGRIGRPSPLSRLVELETLSLGIAGKQALWETLAEAVPERLPELDLPSLAAAARRQRNDLEAHRLRAARMAFAASARPHTSPVREA
jgi:hypothetical protein